MLSTNVREWRASHCAFCGKVLDVDAGGVIDGDDKQRRFCDDTCFAAYLADFHSSAEYKCLQYWLALSEVVG